MKKNGIKIEKTLKQRIAISIVVLVVVLMIVGLFIIYLSPESTRNRYQYEVMSVYRPEDYVEPENNEIKFTNIELLGEFKGNLPVSSGITELREVFTERVPYYLNLTKDMNQDALIKYYNDNVEKISNDLHVETSDSFLNMIKEFKEIDCDIATNIKQCNLSDSDKIDITIEFNNDKKVTCKMTGNYISTFKLEY
jgi:flagellar basal body-associated protein FliL